MEQTSCAKLSNSISQIYYLIYLEKIFHCITETEFPWLVFVIV